MAGLNHFLPDCTLPFSPCLSLLLHPRSPLAACARPPLLGRETSCFPTFLPSKQLGVLRSAAMAVAANEIAGQRALANWLPVRRWRSLRRDCCTTSSRFFRL